MDGCHQQLHLHQLDAGVGQTSQQIYSLTSQSTQLFPELAVFHIPKSAPIQFVTDTKL